MSEQLPAATIVTVLPLTVQTAGVVLAKTTGLVDAPPVADRVNVPFGAYTGAAGLALKLAIAWAARPMLTLSATCVAGL